MSEPTLEMRMEMEPSDIVTQVQRSLTAHTVAEIFANLEQAEVGIKVEDRRLMIHLPEMARTRCIAVAERAVKWLDPDFRVRCADEAVTRYLIDYFAGLTPTESEERIERERAQKIIGLFLETERTEL